VQNGRVHAIWHQFYNSPYHFVALQQIAKWMYPAEFADLDPDAGFREFHTQFLPIGYGGTFWTSL
jgi:iron complex transport system substrate-binding protein